MRVFCLDGSFGFCGQVHVETRGDACPEVIVAISEVGQHANAHVLSVTFESSITNTTTPAMITGSSQKY